MSAGQTAILIASIACVLAVVILLGIMVSLRRQVREMAKVVEDLRRELMPMVAEAHRVVDQAATEMERVGAVLESTESVHSTVDSASRLAYRAFANPVVKVLAVKAGAAGGMRRLTSASPEPPGVAASAASPLRASPPTPGRHSKKARRESPQT
jgi:hypothetical protein